MATTIKSKKKIQQKSVPTLLQAIEKVVELAESFGITERQAVLFCVCMEKGPNRVDYDDLASFLDLNKIGVLSYASDIDALVRRRLLKFRDVKDEDVLPMLIRHCDNERLNEKNVKRIGF